MKEIDVNTWYRKEYFLFYKGFFSSLFSISLETDVTQAYSFCKKNGFSFFIFCLYAFLKAANEVPQFRHRLIDDRVYDMEVLAATTAIMLPDDPNHQFSTLECPYFSTFKEFHREIKKLIKNIKGGVAPKDSTQNLKGFVSLNYVPWFTFTACDNAKRAPNQSLPLMTWGRFKEVNGKKILPYAMQLTHMFIDGYHVGQFTQRLEDFFTYPEKI